MTMALTINLFTLSTGVLALGMMGVLYAWLKKQDTGTPRMQEVARYIGWDKAADLYTQAYEYLRRARGLTLEAEKFNDLAESARRIAHSQTWPAGYPAGHVVV